MTVTQVEQYANSGGTAQGSKKEEALLKSLWTQVKPQIFSNRGDTTLVAG